MPTVDSGQSESAPPNRKRRLVQAEYLDTHQAAALLGVSVVTLEKWRSARIGPAYTSLPRCTRYAIEDLRAFMAAHCVEATERPVDPTERRGRPRKNGQKANASSGIMRSYQIVADKLAEKPGSRTTTTSSLAGAENKGNR